MPLIFLTPKQLRARKRAMKLLMKNSVHLKKCPLCGSTEFERLTNYDRYGIPQDIAICKKCGLVQNLLRYSEHAERKFYKYIYRDLYETNNEPNYKFFYNQRLHGKKIIQLIKHVGIDGLEGKRVLEIGCGAGGILYEFMEHGAYVIGVDFDNRYLDYGRKMGLKLINGDANEAKGKFDIIIYSHVLEHTSNPIKEMKAIRKKLNKHGVVYVEVPGILDMHRQFYGIPELYFQNAHNFYFSSKTLEMVMNSAGYRKLYLDESIKGLFVPSKNNSKNTQSDFENEFSYLESLKARHATKFLKLLIRNTVLFINFLASI